MKSRWIKVISISACALLGLPGTAYGQGMQLQGLVSRPSVKAASVRLGVIGGRYTRQSRVRGLAAGLVGSRQSRLAGGFGSTNFFGAARGFAKLPPAPVPQAFMARAVGIRVPPPSVPSWALGRSSNAALAVASRLTQSQRLDAPLYGFAPREVDITGLPYYAPAPPADSFHAFFGLAPRSPQRVKPTAAQMFDPIKALEQDNTRYIDERLKSALTLLAQATRPDAKNREQLLNQTQQSLVAVVRLRPDSHEAQLLLVNVALMRQHTLQALCYLKQLVANRPTIFVEKPDIARCFGDYAPADTTTTGGAGDARRGRSRQFETLMRENLRIGDDSPSMPQMYAIQAYCAWALNDRARLRQALQRIETAGFTGQARESMTRVRYALAAALRQ